MPAGGESYDWITFEGNFHPSATVSYTSHDIDGSDGQSDELITFPCLVSADPTVVNGPTGVMNYSSVLCRTATGEPPG